MKRHVLFFFFGLMTMFFAGSVRAQDSVSMQEVVELPTVTISSRSNVSKRVSRIFQRDFKGATQTRWYQENKNYLVEFIRDDMRQKALYKRSGRRIYHLAFGKEKDIPIEIRAFIKRVYIDYKITDALRVNEDKRTAWIVNMEDENTTLVVRAENDALLRVAIDPKPAQ
jgi:hypothetical protein